MEHLPGQALEPCCSSNFAGNPFLSWKIGMSIEKDVLTKAAEWLNTLPEKALLREF